MTAREYRFTVTADCAEVKLLTAELVARAKELGLAETERRIGCECDEAFFLSLVEAVYDRATGTFRVIPTPEYDRVLAALWGKPRI